MADKGNFREGFIVASGFYESVCYGREGTVECLWPGMQGGDGWFTTSQRVSR